ncbi:MAG: WG repeat-containing protein, partial [Verrucomicrobia bacterium]|nr:WG repeat-containing protein [Verrucomicrobiota bacterium]
MLVLLLLGWVAWANEDLEQRLFSKGPAPAKGENGKWGFRSPDGTWAVEPKFLEVKPFRHDVAAAREGKTFWRRPAMAGPWGHLPAPTSLPKWIGCDGFAGLVAYNAPNYLAPGIGEREQTRMVMRAVALPETPTPTFAVIIDIPLSTAIETRLRQETGIQLGELTAFLARGVQPVVGKA